MKVLDIFGFFLTVGILGSAVAETLQYVPVGGMMNYLMRQQVEQLCKKNGGPKAFEACENSFKTVHECVANMTMKLHKINEDTVRSSGKLDPQLQLYCRNLPVLRECVEPHIQIAKACTDPEDKIAFDITWRIFDVFTASTCNNSVKLEKLGEHSSISCLKSKYKDLLICAEDFVNYLAARFVKYAFGQMHGRKESVPLQIGNSCSLDGCQMLEAYQTCSIKVLNECENKLPADALALLFNDINPHIPCKNLIKSRP